MKYLYLMGHTRMVTHGDPSIIENNQPIINKNSMILHNGIVTNYNELIPSLKALDKDSCLIDSDSCIDPFVDGNAQNRIVEYIQLLLNSVEKSKSNMIRESNIIYKRKYGNDKVLEKEGL